MRNSVGVRGRASSDEAVHDVKGGFLKNANINVNKNGIKWLEMA